MYFNIETKEAPFIINDGTGLAPTPHLHTHVEMVYFLNGSSLCCADNREATAEQGDLFIAFPNQIHHYHDIVSPMHHILIFSPDWCPDFSALFRTMIPASPVIKKDALPPYIDKLLANLKAKIEENTSFSEAAAKARLLLLLSELFPHMSLEKMHGEYDGSVLKKTIGYCYDHYNSDISLESAETALGVSRYYISHLFREKLHIGFKEYINFLRIQSACEMLKQQEKTITEIAYDAGFGTTRTFNRCFLSAKGVSPKTYRTAFNEKSIP